MLRIAQIVALMAGGWVAAFSPAPAAPPSKEPVITWKKITLDFRFRSEGVAIADVNKDGKMDVLNGEYWYEAPYWQAHEMQPYRDYKDGLTGYSHSFACWADDINRDGWKDI